MSPSAWATPPALPSEQPRRPVHPHGGRRRDAQRLGGHDRFLFERGLQRRDRRDIHHRLQRDPFPGAFVYDPSLGNLLVEIVNTTAATTVNEPVSRSAGDVTSSARTPRPRSATLSPRPPRRGCSFTYTIEPEAPAPAACPTVPASMGRASRSAPPRAASSREATPSAPASARSPGPAACSTARAPPASPRPNARPPVASTRATARPAPASARNPGRAASSTLCIANILAAACTAQAARSRAPARPAATAPPCPRSCTATADSPPARPRSAALPRPPAARGPRWRATRPTPSRPTPSPASPPPPACASPTTSRSPQAA
jgi:hypothetical protein